MTSVGVRQFRNRLSAFLRRVQGGERLVVTDRGRAVAVVVPLARDEADRGVEAILREGSGRWAGGKPRGAARPPRIRGAPVSQAVIEDRR